MHKYDIYGMFIVPERKINHPSQLHAGVGRMHPGRVAGSSQGPS